MIDDLELDWVRDRLRGDVDQLLVATSLPFLLTPGLHHLEAWDEAVADYERRMLDYGFAAVARSLRNTRFAASGHRVARGLLRAVNLAPPLKRRMLES